MSTGQTLVFDGSSAKPKVEPIPDEIIAALSRLRWLKVISRGSSFRFREDNPDVREVGRTLSSRTLSSQSLRLL